MITYTLNEKRLEICPNEDGMYFLSKLNQGNRSKKPQEFLQQNNKALYKDVVTVNGRFGGTWSSEGVAIAYLIWLGAESVVGTSGNEVCNVNVERAETEFGRNVIYNMFSEYKILEQHPVLDGKYKIDWFIPELNLAIEFDEHDHTWNSDYDKARQKEIEESLGCKFARYKKGL